MAARAAVRCLTACVVALLLVVLAALPDDVAAMPPSQHKGVVAAQMQTAPATGASTRAVMSASLTDADLPPGDGRDLRQAVPVLVRPAVSARFVAAVCVDPSPTGHALPERPPRAA